MNFISPFQRRQAARILSQQGHRPASDDVLELCRQISAMHKKAVPGTPAERTALILRLLEAK